MHRLYIMFTCYCTAGYLCTEYILCLLVIVLQDMNIRNERSGSTLNADEVQFTQVNIR